jgi:hypothetical protein
VYIETVEYFDASIVCTLLGGGGGWKLGIWSMKMAFIPDIITMYK